MSNDSNLIIGHIIGWRCDGNRMYLEAVKLNGEVVELFSTQNVTGHLTEATKILAESIVQIEGYAYLPNKLKTMI